VAEHLEESELIVLECRTCGGEVVSDLDSSPESVLCEECAEYMPTDEDYYGYQEDSVL